ncbi:MAG: hypothetical protein LUO88_02075 [Methanoregulaceae archaeon]|nr:hypothetical protein [Methanoregulaceae archaeon]
MPKEAGNGKPTLVPPGPGVVIRMYHTGFGDCFLLAFHADDGGVRHILIDCGVHQGDPRGKTRLPLIAQDIKSACGNKLHAIAVTHEHTDHISGFSFGESIFAGIEIQELWLAWTEDPKNPVAGELKEVYKARLRALSAAVSHLRALGNSRVSGIEGIMEFNTFMAAGKRSNPEILEWLRSKPAKKLESSRDYLTPGDTPFCIPGVSGMRCFVLGPPPDVRGIGKLKDGGETYSGFSPITEMSAFGAAAVMADTVLDPWESAGTTVLSKEKLAAREEFIRSCPFDERSILTREQAAAGAYAKFFRDHYGLYEGDKGPEWRRIETDWLASAEQLALSINDYTNNTSLVLAFGLTGTETEKILLFVGDAQVGNWLSWQQLSWPGAGREGTVLTGKDLLRQTVFYKVGHHGSSNATLSRNGLELMESPDLVAMIPVDQEWAAARRPTPWAHPEEPVVRRLLEKTNGRVIRSDVIPPKRPEGYGESIWKQFCDSVEYDTGPDKLWIQYTIRQPG